MTCCQWKAERQDLRYSLISHEKELQETKHRQNVLTSTIREIKWTAHPDTEAIRRYEGELEGAKRQEACLTAAIRDGKKRMKGLKCACH